MQDDRDPYVVGRGYTLYSNVMVHSGFEVIFPTGQGVLLVRGDPLVFLLRARSSLSRSSLPRSSLSRSSLSRDYAPRDGQGVGVLRRGVLQSSHAHLCLRRPPMRTIIRRRQLVVAELVRAVAVDEVLVGVGGVDAHD